MPEGWIETMATNPMKLIQQRKAEGKAVSLSLAVKAKCWDCMGGGPTVDDEVVIRMISECESSPDIFCPCPLWEFRPYQVKVKS